jgi:hypothetical protein
MDNHIKTPYAESFNFSFQHQLPAGFTFEEAYVGRLGHHLLQELDLAEPDYVDPAGGGDYFAARILSRRWTPPRLERTIWHLCGATQKGEQQFRLFPTSRMSFLT